MALEAQRAIDRDFTSDTCQLQFGLMFRSGREWIAKDPQRNCAEVLSQLQKLNTSNIFRGLIR